ncbi:hypothetical protein [Sediminicola sp. 1XM1-17]|uniref:hypothetical protein n=1 Tax=Sediminicola sp. 1XM1-17 TaxID=3127702 RepID=UPI0030777FFD
MKPSFKAFFYNFIGFGILFIVIRAIMWVVLPGDSILLAIVAAIMASVLSPKFAATKTKDGEKLFMKWLFMKGIKKF